MDGHASLPLRTERFAEGYDAMADEPERLTKTEARAGSTPGVARNVLTYGLILVVVLFAIILFVAR